MANTGVTKKRGVMWAGFMLGCVWFATHCGGGFATGNQAVQYWVQYGWTCIFLPFFSMLFLSYIMRIAVIMARTNNLWTYKEVFEHLWKPFPKLELTFELFYWIIMIAAVGGAIAGAASLFVAQGLTYETGIMITAIILLFLTIFGAKLVTRASTLFVVLILLSLGSIYIVGTAQRWDVVVAQIKEGLLPLGPWAPLWAALIYASFQAVSIPSVVACSQEMTSKKRINAFMFWGAILNGLALCLACILVFGWYPEIQAAGDVKHIALPDEFITRRLGYDWIYGFYFLALFLAFISTGVSCIFAMVVRLENSIFKKATGLFSNIMARRCLISVFCMAVSVGVSLVGLTNIVKYGYGLCGYLSLAFIMLPMLIIGNYKNAKFFRENPNFKFPGE
ncbi:hypothetical protein LJC36_06340, partial [Desulfovibrio sp. OttesenSCG-928-C14]|nr:hypothetical protein [Desulfovibrio sp. OttesenSCG-928-C14]